ncbi:hypothetical protein IKF57_02820 [Candidatus Saccharibacteria bacterium]|nr:hypothetical protein [Candidatus Saccharibacteria bacterium]
MNKRYIDFVPGKPAARRPSPKPASRPVAKPAPKPVAKPVSKPVAKPAPKPVAKPAPKPAPKPAAKPAPRPTPKPTTTKLGVIEDLPASSFTKESPHFAAESTQKSTLGAAKSIKVGNAAKPALKPAPKSHGLADKRLFSTPTPPFINQEKITRRPLSKNVYPKKPPVLPPTEAPKGPVTIISKPEKDAHVGLIVTIILTIILGAAAGTVAFLLLPK